MPTYTIRREVNYEVMIEAPTEEIALAEAKEWGSGDWGYEDEEVYSLGQAAADARPDYTVDLKGVEHEHAFEDEDTGACIYCNEPKPAEQVG